MQRRETPALHVSIHTIAICLSRRMPCEWQSCSRHHSRRSLRSLELLKALVAASTKSKVHGEGSRDVKGFPSLLCIADSHGIMCSHIPRSELHSGPSAVRGHPTLHIDLTLHSGRRRSAASRIGRQSHIITIHDSRQRCRELHDSESPADTTDPVSRTLPLMNKGALLTNCAAQFRTARKLFVACAASRLRPSSVGAYSRSDDQSNRGVGV